MIRKRIRHIFRNYKRKLTIYDYIQEPEIAIKKVNLGDVKYEARPIFNSIKVGENKKSIYTRNVYRIYKLKNRKKR